MTNEFDYDTGVRAVALQAAANFCAPVKASNAEDVLRLADQFEQYLRVGTPEPWYAKESGT